MKINYLDYNIKILYIKFFLLKMKTFILLILFINYAFINLARIPADYEIAPWHAWKQGAITYSFDDGCPGQLSSAIPTLNKYGLKATFNVVTNWV